MRKAPTLLALAAVSALLATVSTAAAADAPRFKIRAYAGQAPDFGGKCLDYAEPPAAGAVVFVANCETAHPFGVEEVDVLRDVVLRAGPLVIGVRNGAPVARGGEPGTQSTVEARLELQTPAGTAGVGTAPSTFPAEQVFALDGDSIIYAANRNFVAKVRNAGGRDGTHVVLGARELADHELWDFAPVDDPNRYPTTGFALISNRLDFEKYVCALPCESPASWGTVLIIDPTDGLLNLSYLRSFRIPAGVTLRGDRRGTRVGAQLLSSGPTDGYMLEVIGDHVRITGLRLQGPSRSTDPDQTSSRGIMVWPDTFTHQVYTGTIIDHNDISDWTVAAVEVREGDESDSCNPRDHRDPKKRAHNVRIARNFIHHNREEEKGYGVVASNGGYPFIEGNTFVSNRHAIAGDGKARSGYRAWANLVLSNAPLQHGVFHTHDFDMHGTGSDGFGGIAGSYVDIFRNTFLGTNRNNFELRGSPCNFVEFHENISLESKDDAVEFTVGFFGSGVADLRISPTPNQFDHANPTRRLGVGNFDGDGQQDLFLATGSAWYYAPGGAAEWRYLSAKQETIDDVLLGDFDGDGRTDVVAKEGSRLVVSWGGVSEWEPLNRISAPLGQLAVGNFDGDNRADIFYGDGTQWYVAFGGDAPFTPVATSSFRVANLRFGDFDGGGTTDVFGVVSGAWRASYGATTSWSLLRPRLTDDVDGLVVADFDADGRADVARSERVTNFLGTFWRWKFSRSGIDNWTERAPDAAPYLWNVPLSAAAGIGRFDGTGQIGVLLWNGTVLDIAPAGPIQGFVPVRRYSGSDMR